MPVPARRVALQLALAVGALARKVARQGAGRSEENIITSLSSGVSAGSSATPAAREPVPCRGRNASLTRLAQGAQRLRASAAACGCTSSVADTFAAHSPQHALPKCFDAVSAACNLFCCSALQHKGALARDERSR